MSTLLRAESKLRLGSMDFSEMRGAIGPLENDDGVHSPLRRTRMFVVREIWLGENKIKRTMYSYRFGYNITYTVKSLQCRDAECATPTPNFRVGSPVPQCLPHPSLLTQY